MRNLFFIRSIPVPVTSISIYIKRDLSFASFKGVTFEVFGIYDISRMRLVTGLPAVSDLRILLSHHCLFILGQMKDDVFVDEEANDTDKHRVGIAFLV